MNEHSKRVLALVSKAAIYVPYNGEGIRIDYWELPDNGEGYFQGTGEESGESYCVEFCDVDLDKDLFYKLEALN